jgi:cysteine desulfurase
VRDRAALAATGDRAARLRLAWLSRRLWQRLQTSLGDTVVRNGHPRQRLPNTLNVSFLGQSGAELLARVPEIAASTGSACHEDRPTASPVLDAMNVPPAVAQGAIRLSVGRYTTDADVTRAADLLASAVGAPLVTPAAGTRRA